MPSIKELLAEDTGKAIDFLKPLFETKNGDLYNSIIHQSGRWNGVKKQRDAGGTSQDFLNMQENQIRIAVGNLIDQYERDYGKIVMPTNSPGINPVPNPTPAATKMAILFLAANPKDKGRLQVDLEYRRIRERIQLSNHRDKFKLEHPELAVTLDNLIQAFLSVQPQIVHFAGHSDQPGIHITDGENNAKLMPNATLKMLFEDSKDVVKITVLSSCYSAAQAEIISKLGVYVVGMSSAVTDDAAIAFSTGFYLGLGENLPVERAFRTGIIRLSNDFSGEVHLPVLWKDGVQIAGGAAV
jgi:hypothetical protein